MKNNENKIKHSSKEIPRNVEISSDSSSDDSLLGFADKEGVGSIPNTKFQDQVNKALLDAESQRRELFEQVIWLGVMVIVGLYFMLALWIFCSNESKSNNLWHIAMILALPPTTILFLLVKVLSKTENSERNKEQENGLNNFPATQFLNQLLDILKTWVNKKYPN